MNACFARSLLAGALTLALTGTASAPTTTGRVIVKYVAAYPRRSAEQSSAAPAGRAARDHPRRRARRRCRAATRRRRRALNRSARSAYAEVDQILRATATPNDTRFGELYGLNNTGQSGGTADADIDAPEGWDTAGLGGFPATGGAKVGIVDTGIQPNHEDLTGKIANCAQSRGLFVLGGSIQEGSCADDNGHGTHVAGTIAANANNGKGVAGVAFNSPLAICRALGGPLGSGNTTDVANCITWLKDKGVKVISMSLGGGASTTLPAGRPVRMGRRRQRRGRARGGGRQRRRRDAELPGRLRRGRLGRGDGPQRRAGVVLERQRRRGGRGARRGHPVDVQRTAATRCSRAPRWPPRTSPA